MKIRLTGATFTAAAKTVLHTSFSDVGLAGIQLIVNVTDQVIIYNFADTAKGGTLSTDTLTLEYDTTSMSDTDELMILVEDGTTTQPVSGTVTANLSATDNAVLDAIAASVAAIDTDTTTLIGHVDGVEGLLTTIDGDTGNIATSAASIDTKTPALGQALAAASVPVVLTAAQISTLTPPTPQTDALTNTQLRATAVPVSVASIPSHAVTNAGTFVTQENGALLTAAQLLDDTVFADDAAVTLGTSKGNVLAGVAVQTDGTDPSAVSAEGDAAALRTDMNRLLIVNQTHPRFFHVSADYASAQTNASVKAAPGASLSLYITDIQVSNGATAGNITLLDGSGGTVLYELYPGINGGAVLSLRNPIKLTANTALCITSTTVTTHSIFVSGYIAA